MIDDIAMGLAACSNPGGITIAAIQPPAAEKTEGVEPMDHLATHPSSASYVS